MLNGELYVERAKHTALEQYAIQLHDVNVHWLELVMLPEEDAKRKGKL